MKQTLSSYFTKLLFCGAGFVLAAGPAMASPKPVTFSSLCTVAEDRAVAVTTESGATVSGKCVEVDGEMLTLQTAAGEAHVQRGLIQKVSISRGKGRNLRKVKGWLERDRHFFREHVLSPYGAPASIGFGIMAASHLSGVPFAVVGDVVDHFDNMREVKLR